MLDSKEYLQQDMELQRMLKRQYETRLEKLPDGHLIFSNVKGINYYSKVVGDERIYLGRFCEKNCEEIKALQEKRLINEVLKRIDTNSNMVSAAIASYRSINLDEINQELPKAYQLFPLEVYDFGDWINPSQWGKSTYEKNMNYPEGLTHRTAKGDLVRSKSEVIIADMLYLKGIEYHYEEKLKIGRNVFYPDFKIAVRSERRFKHLEHMGMLGNEKYLEDSLWKIGEYIAHGYLPGRDVIFTFDDLDGKIDSQLIGWIIDRFCL